MIADKQLLEPVEEAGRQNHPGTTAHAGRKPWLAPEGKAIAVAAITRIDPGVNNDGIFCSS